MTMRRGEEVYQLGFYIIISGKVSSFLTLESRGSVSTYKDGGLRRKQGKHCFHRWKRFESFMFQGSSLQVKKKPKFFFGHLQHLKSCDQLIQKSLSNSQHNPIGQR